MIKRIWKRTTDRVRNWVGHKFGFFENIAECEERIAHLATLNAELTAHIKGVNQNPVKRQKIAK